MSQLSFPGCDSPLLPILFWPKPLEPKSKSALFPLLLRMFIELLLTFGIHPITQKFGCQHPLCAYSKEDIVLIEKSYNSLINGFSQRLHKSI